MKKILSSLVCLLLLASTIISAMPVYAQDVGTSNSKPGYEEIPYTDHDESLAASANYDSSINAYTAEEAASAGVPAGYSGYVLKVNPNSNTAYAGICIDFSEQNIPIENIESITFRVYMYSTSDGLRILNSSTSGSAWIMLKTPTQANAWVDISLKSDGTGFETGKSFSNIANTDGNLGKFCLIGRFKGGTNYFYLDEISVAYKSGATSDVTPPVISYDGPLELSAYEGEVFSLAGAKAYDEYDDMIHPITYSWPNGAIDSYGALKLGSYTCTASATDRSGNTSTLTLTVTVKSDTSLLKLEDVPYTDYVDGVTPYRGTVTEYDSTAAAAAGVPDGYVGGVLKVSSSYYNLATTFDPTALRIPTNLIQSITFRCYFPSAAASLRISKDGGKSWTALANNQPQGVWTEFSLKSDGSGFSNDYNMKYLGDEDGYLDIFGIGIGDKEASEYAFYIDSITIKLKRDDGAAPVIDYDGDTDIVTSSGKPFVLDATAFDALENREIEFTYEWSEGALNNGLLVEGVHTCLASATDYYGNTSTLNLNVTVGGPDTEKPEILFYPEQITVLSGTYAQLTVKAADNFDKLTVDMVWSDGAIDIGGRLLVGEHTLTLTATDLTGNTETKVIVVHVVDADADVGVIIRCGDN